MGNFLCSHLEMSFSRQSEFDMYGESIDVLYIGRLRIVASIDVFRFRIDLPDLLGYFIESAAGSSSFAISFRYESSLAFIVQFFKAFDIRFVQ